MKRKRPKVYRMKKREFKELLNKAKEEGLIYNFPRCQWEFPYKIGKKTYKLIILRGEDIVNRDIVAVRHLVDFIGKRLSLWIKNKIWRQE